MLTDRQTHRHTDRQTDRQTHRQYIATALADEVTTYMTDTAQS